MSEKEVGIYGGGYGLLTNLVLTEGISPYVAYSFLKAHFGAPQYKMKNLSDYDKVQWQYFIKSSKSYLRIYDWKLFDWSIGIGRDISAKLGTATQPEEQRAMSDAKFLLSRIKKYARTTARVPVAKHRYQLVENVFQTNYSRAEGLFNLMTARTSYTDMSALAWSAAVSYIFSVEGLLNLVYDIYLNSNIRENTNLQEHLQRLSLIDKWCLASYVCYCFSSPLKNSSKGYQSLKKLVNLRNQWAHSSITPEMRTFFIREDDLSFATTPVPVAKHFDVPGEEISFVKGVRRDTDSIVSELLQAVRPELRASFLEVLRYEAISLDTEKVPLRGPRHEYWP
jgi:hypothetical protein